MFLKMPGGDQEAFCQNDRLYHFTNAFVNLDGLLFFGSFVRFLKEREKTEEVHRLL
jgi:hypothetical protein